MLFKFWKDKIVVGGQVWRIRRVRKDGNLLCLQKVSHNTCLVSGCIIMQKSNILKSCFGSATFAVVLQFSQNKDFIELACDHSAFWHRNLNSWTLISEKYIQNLLYRCICLAIPGRLAFLVAHIRLATFRFGSK